MRKLLNAGKRRLRKVAKMCVNYGQRVQNSVFECLLDASQTDSLRFYQLGNNYRRKVEHFGCAPLLSQDDVLLI